MAATSVMLKTIRAKFSDVSHLSTDNLYSLMNEANNDGTILLLDARENNEVAISQLADAHHVIPDSDITEVKEKIKDEQCNIKHVVAYCSLGYRSSQLIQRLRSELKNEDTPPGKIKLYNLEGGIFKWANEGRQVVDRLGKPTSYVHPYNSVWGCFLDAEKRKYTEENTAKY